MDCLVVSWRMSSAPKSEQLQIRVTPDQKAALKALAERAGTDLSTYVLTRALPRLQAEFLALVDLVRDPERRRWAFAELNDLLTDLGREEFHSVWTLPIGFDLLEPVWQNHIAAMVEEAAGHLGVAPPDWTLRVEPLESPWFPEGFTRLRAWLLMASPVPFRRRNIFVESALGTRVSSGGRVRERLAGWSGGTGVVRYARQGLAGRTGRRLPGRVREQSPAWGPEPIVRDRFVALLDQLSVELGERGVTGEVWMVGGAVMSLVLGAREATRDIDGALRPRSELVEAAAAVARRVGVPEDWINDAVRGFLSPQGEFEPFLDLPHLRVYAAHPEYMLAMKCLAMRDAASSPDHGDVRFLLRYLGVSTAAEALAIVTRYYDEPMVTLRTRLLLEELMGEQP